MTELDAFAAAAMQALLSNRGTTTLRGGDADDVAREAYEVARAMMKQRPATKPARAAKPKA